MMQMCKSVDVSALESNLEKSKAVIKKNPDHLEYLCEFHDHPERCAQ